MNKENFSQSSDAIFTPVWQRIGIIGGGAWGTALACVVARAGREVALWSRRDDIVEAINVKRRNPTYLGDLELPDGITATTDLATVARGNDALLFVTPSRTVRALCRELAGFMPVNVPLFLCAKGIEVGSGLLLSEVAAEELPKRPIGVLSGPTFAHEAARGFPTSVTIASHFDALHRFAPEESAAARLSVSLGSEAFRPYVSDDVVGVEIGGAVKNVVAIACGMMTGAGFAENTRAALITRGLDEMKALANALGGQRETVTGLSGIGDLTLTCSSTASRNMSLGVQLGQGRRREECFDGRPVVVEGEINAISVTDLARREGLEMPICEAVRSILHDGAAIGETFAALWSRPLEAEPRALELSLAHPADPDTVRRFAETMS